MVHTTGEGDIVEEGGLVWWDDLDRRRIVKEGRTARWCRGNWSQIEPTQDYCDVVDADPLCFRSIHVDNQV